MMRMLDDYFYLVASKTSRGPHDLSFRITSKAPTLKTGEVAIRMNIRLPAALFTRPSLEAIITVPADRVAAEVVKADVSEQIAETVKRNLGIDMTISVGE